ncbi:MAG: hypothetical protein KIT20_15630 [Alphaproteobacteria bacterium]|nr:hypothetical protein [Alphaproteobacteria bacterium]
MRLAAALVLLAASLPAAPAHACACCADPGAYHVMELETARLDLESATLAGSLSVRGEIDPPAELPARVVARIEGTRLIVSLADRTMRAAGRISLELPPRMEAEVADSRYYAVAPMPAAPDATVLLWRLRAEGRVTLEGMENYRPADGPARLALFLRGNHCLDLAGASGWSLVLSLVDRQGMSWPVVIGGILPP